MSLHPVSPPPSQVRTYERLSTMVPLTESLDADYGRVQAGDCIVAFSRKDIVRRRRGGGGGEEEEGSHRVPV